MLSVLKFVIIVSLLFLSFKKKKKSLLALSSLCRLHPFGTLWMSLETWLSDEFFHSFNIQQIFVESYVASISHALGAYINTSWGSSTLHQL